MDEDNKEEHKEKREEHKKGINPFIHRLINSLGKKVTVIDTEGTTHDGQLLAYSQPYLNLCIKVKNKIRFIRNLSWFEREFDETDDIKENNKNK